MLPALATESNNFWVVRVVSAWQARTDRDGDPNIALPAQGCPARNEGLIHGFTYGNVSKTSVIDGGDLAIILRGSNVEGPANEPVTVAHEIGHQFGLAHGDWVSPADLQLPECAAGNCTEAEMGLMRSGLGTNSTALIPRYQNLIRSRVTSPGQ